MAKRFTDTDIWKRQRWFRKLSPINKLVFCYIKDNCNHAGIWRVDCSDLVDDLGIDEFNLSEFIQSVNTEFDKVSGAKIKKERLLLSGSLLWLSGFIQFQYESKDGKVNPEVPAVRTALHLLEGVHNPLEGLDNPYGTLSEPLKDPFTLLNYALFKKHITLSHPLREAWQRHKDKDKDKDKDYTTQESNTKSLTSEEKNQKNGKQLSDSKTQEQDYFVKRMERHRIEAEQS